MVEPDEVPVPDDVPVPGEVPVPDDVPVPEDVPEPDGVVDPLGGAAAAATVTVIDVTVVPFAFVALRMYVVVWDGDTTWEPLFDTDAP